MTDLSLMGGGRVDLVWVVTSSFMMKVGRGVEEGGAEVVAKRGVLVLVVVLVVCLLLPVVVVREFLV